MGLEVDRDRVVGPGHRDVHVLAVGRRRHPVRGWPDLDPAEELIVRERPAVDAAVEPARGPHGRAVGEHLEAVHRRSLVSVCVALPRRERWREEHPLFLTRLPVEHPDAVHAGAVGEQLVGRAVVPRQQRHRPHGVVPALVVDERERPDDLVDVRVDDLDRVHATRIQSREDPVPIRAHVHVVDSRRDRNAPELLVCVQAEHVDEGRGSNPDVDLAMLLVDRRLVRPSCKRELLDELQRAGVIDVERILHLARAVVVEPLRVGEEVVRPRTALDDAYDLVRQRVDDVLDVAGVVALQDPDNNPVVGVEPWDLLSRDRCPEERRSQEQQEETVRPRGVHQRPPKAVGTLALKGPSGEGPFS